MTAVINKNYQKVKTSFTTSRKVLFIHYYLVYPKKRWSLGKA